VVAGVTPATMSCVIGLLLSNADSLCSMKSRKTAVNDHQPWSCVTACAKVWDDLTLHDPGSIRLKDCGRLWHSVLLRPRFFCLGESDLYGH
jgi:hypothetical protein